MNRYSIGCTAALAMALTVPSFAWGQQGSASSTPEAQEGRNAGGQDASDAKIAAIPMEQLVTATCRQAWHLGGRNQDGFLDIVERLTALSAKNRGVTLPDDKEAGARAGQWIRTQALKDPDQLLYAVVDEAVQHSIAKGRATKTGGASTSTNTPPSK